MGFPKWRIVMKGILAVLVIIAIWMALLLVRQNQIVENGAAGAGVGFGWVFFFYATLISWIAVGSVSLLLLKRK